MVVDYMSLVCDPEALLEIANSINGLQVERLCCHYRQVAKAMGGVDRFSKDMGSAAADQLVGTFVDQAHREAANLSSAADDIATTSGQMADQLENFSEQYMSKVHPAAAALEQAYNAQLGLGGSGTWADLRKNATALAQALSELYSGFRPPKPITDADLAWADFSPLDASGNPAGSLGRTPAAGGPGQRGQNPAPDGQGGGSGSLGSDLGQAGSELVSVAGDLASGTGDAACAATGLAAAIPAEAGSATPASAASSADEAATSPTSAVDSAVDAPLTSLANPAPVSGNHIAGAGSAAKPLTAIPGTAQELRPTPASAALTNAQTTSTTSVVSSGMMGMPMMGAGMMGAGGSGERRVASYLVTKEQGEKHFTAALPIASEEVLGGLDERERLAMQIASIEETTGPGRS